MNFRCLKNIFVFFLLYMLEKNRRGGGGHCLLDPQFCWAFYQIVSLKRELNSSDFCYILLKCLQSERTKQKEGTAHIFIQFQISERPPFCVKSDHSALCTMWSQKVHFSVRKGLPFQDAFLHSSILIKKAFEKQYTNEIEFVHSSFWFRLIMWKKGLY